MGASRSDKHINTAESATGDRGTGPLLTSASDAASTEDKTPGCTIAFSCMTHPFDPTRRVVHVRGQWADGQYAPFPATSDGVPFAKAPDKATNAPGGLLRQVRIRGGYAAHGGHYRLGYVFDMPADGVDDLLAWLSQAKAAFEARLPQVPKPARPGKSKAQQALPVGF